MTESHLLSHCRFVFSTVRPLKICENSKSKEVESFKRHYTQSKAILTVLHCSPLNIWGSKKSDQWQYTHTTVWLCNKKSFIMRNKSVIETIEPEQLKHRCVISLIIQEWHMAIRGDLWTISASRFWRNAQAKYWCASKGSVETGLKKEEKQWKSHIHIIL